MEKATERLQEIYGTRKWILVNSVAVAMGRMNAQLAEWGCKTMAVVSSPGVGEPPDIPIVLSGSSGTSILDGIRSFLLSVASPSQAVLAAVDEFDSDREAGVLLPLWADNPDALARRAYGVRRRSWIGLEDKVEVLRLWDEADVTSPPHLVVPVGDAPAAAQRMASDLGSVWAADNKEGWHGGAEMLRWVAGPYEHDEAVEFLGKHADRVRVTPFLDGLPCSIHGWVGPDDIAVFRPVEILIFRTPDHRFFYGGVSTRWDPPAELREEMRSVARRVGEAARRLVDYRGPYGIDGIATQHGFLPTEFNARTSSGFAVQTSRLGLPIGLAVRAQIEDDFEPDLTEVEEQVVATADAERALRVFLPIPGEEHQATKVHLALDIGGFRVVDVGHPDTVGTMELGPADFGSAVVAQLEPDEVGVGEPMGPLAVELASLAVETWSVGLPDLSAAPDVTR